MTARNGGLAQREGQASVKAAILACVRCSPSVVLLAGTSSSALLPTWAVYALLTLMQPPRSLSRGPSSSSGPARNGPSLACLTCPSCVPARNHQSRSRDGTALAWLLCFFSLRHGLHMSAKTAGGLRSWG